jgi:hypothetical protein
MALADKNIVITPNISLASDPKIVFSGADAITAAQNITLTAYPTLNGMLSFDGSAGQLLSVTNSLTGTIFAANDVSGIPSIEVLDTGLVKLAQYGGNVLIGTGTDDGLSKLQVSGGIKATSIGITNISPTTGLGISLYNGPATGSMATFGLSFSGTGTYGTHGAVTGDWVTYFTVDNTANRGWIFKNTNIGIGGNVASISNAGTISTTTTMYVDSASSNLEVGYKIVPQVSKSVDYPTVLTDSGKHIFHPAADTTSRTYTIDNAVAYPIGTVLTFINEGGAGVISITISGASALLALVGTGATTVPKSLAANGMATAIKITSTKWLISGSGLT